MPQIKRLTALEILDSRGRPTVRATCGLDSGATASASVPSGASTGTAEAIELRDGDPGRYGGNGCRRAVGHVRNEIAGAVVGRNFLDQASLDQALIDLDGTPNKARLGANAALAVSLAFARASAAASEMPLHQYFSSLDEPVQSDARLAGSALRAPSLPRMTINLFSGGKHAGGQVPIQDVLLVPASAQTIDAGLAMCYAVYRAAVELTAKRYGSRALTADEGGLAPPFQSIEAMFADAVESIQQAGLVPGKDVALAIDVASTHFFSGGSYHLGPERVDSNGMIARLLQWLDRFPIVSIEDGLAENDWEHWPKLMDAAAGRALILGDDLLCTNPARIRRAVEARAAGALLLKVNQIGTLTEAAEAMRIARQAGWRVTVSARSGETEDNWLADLAVAWGDQIKVGSITQSERLAKYNRLLEIEADTGWPVVRWPT